MLLAEGPLGRGITPFEGNYYVSRKYLRTSGFKPNFIQGLCPSKIRAPTWRNGDLPHRNPRPLPTPPFPLDWGYIWQALNSKGELSVAQLKREVKGKSPIFDWAIGWLAREDKIVVTQEKRSFRLRLKEQAGAASTS